MWRGEGEKGLDELCMLAMGISRACRCYTMKMYGYGFAREAAVHGNTESPHPHLSHTNPLTLHSGSKPATCVQGRRGKIKSNFMISG